MRTTVATLGDEPIGDKADDFWRKRFGVWVGVEPAPRAPPDTRGSREARVWAEAAAALDRRDGGGA
jgi:hypothetical protein